MLVEADAAIEPYSLVESEIDTGRYAWMDVILRRWAHRLETTLFERLGIMCEVSADAAEGMRFEEFGKQFSTQCPIYIFETDFHGSGLMVLDNRFAHACLQPNAKARLQEQPDTVPHLNTKSHQRLQNLLVSLLRDFKKSWQGVAEVRLFLKKVTTHFFRAKVMAPFEKCIVTRVRFRSHGFTSHLTLCFPYMTLDRILQREGKKSTLPPEQLENYYSDVQDHFRQKLEDCDYEVVAELGSIELSAHHGQPSIQVGQILPLQSVIGSELTIKVNNQPVLTGTIGQTEDFYAVQVVGDYQEKKAEFRSRPRSFNPIRWPQA